ncbi:MAG: hypothetical protein RIK87_12605 [Fuerstiella sp.]
MPFRSSTIVLVLLCSLSVMAGCSDTAPPSPSPPVRTAADPAPEKPAPAAVAGAERQSFDGMGFVIPADWEKVPLSQFQMGIISARFQMPEAGSEVTLTLSRSGGGLEANLDRWRGQFQQSRPEVMDSISVAGTDATWIDLEGQYSDSFRGVTHSDWRMIGIIVPLPEQAYFLKLLGPKDEVAAVEADFRSFAESGQIQ